MHDLLEYKTKPYGITLTRVNPQGTSSYCPRKRNCHIIFIFQIKVRSYT
ncbi:MAG: zinc ribbon domain-containing protein [Candidatus Heimdallarchaeota archaeon]